MNRIFIFLINKTNYIYFLRFDVFTALTVKNAVFWNVAPRDSGKNRRFGGIYRLCHQDDKSRLAGNSVNSN
jgi:hypothetical protein